MDIHLDNVRKRLAAREKQYLKDPGLKPAAVLLLMYPKADDHCIMFTVRTSLVEDHKGEISFPGGAYHDGEDGSLLETAIRETAEEVGVLPSNVEILGELDDAPTRSNYIISPYVATLKEPQAFKAFEIEVAEILEVPLKVLLAPGTMRYGETQPVKYAGRSIPGLYYYYQGYVIFGVTARMLNQFLEVCFPEPFTS